MEEIEEIYLKRLISLRDLEYSHIPGYILIDTINEMREELDPISIFHTFIRVRSNRYLEIELRA